jgi:hypothetical protein
MLAVVEGAALCATWHVISSGLSSQRGVCALNRITAVLLVSLDAFSRGDAAKIDV